jgi:hypothetical protein
MMIYRGIKSLYIDLDQKERSELDVARLHSCVLARSLTLLFLFQTLCSDYNRAEEFYKRQFRILVCLVPWACKDEDEDVL